MKSLWIKMARFWIVSKKGSIFIGPADVERPETPDEPRKITDDASQQICKMCL